MTEPKNRADSFERALKERGQQKFILRLYVSGMTSKSTSAIDNITRICEEHLLGRYELQVIDIYQHPSLARERQILTVPTLLKELPPPLRRLIGSLSDEQRVLKGLDILVTP